MPVGLVTSRWRDYQGRIARVKFWTTQPAGADAIITAIENLTNCALQSYIGVDTLMPAPLIYGAANQFRDAEDKLSVLMESTAGTRLRMELPAPNHSTFQADLATVDPGNAAWLALVTALTVHATTRDGMAIARVFGGVRTRRAAQRRVNIITRAAGGGPAE